MDVEFEPLFASMALYDAKEKKKISENFYFDFNADAFKGMLRNFIPHQDVSTLCRSVLYNITYPSNDLFLVIRVSSAFLLSNFSFLCVHFSSKRCSKLATLAKLSTRT
jgi:hypothetical protein